MRSVLIGDYNEGCIRIINLRVLLIRLSELNGSTVYVKTGANHTRIPDVFRIPANT